MCAIVHFKPGAMIPKEEFFNVVRNNWHGYGIILKDGNGKMQLLQDCPKDGNDPEVLWKIIEDNKDIERIMHVRHATKGAVDLSNAQPFLVYSSSVRDIYFAHNGTLGSFGTNSTYNHGVGSTPTGKSDSLDFCEKVLTPALLRWEGANGKGDYLDDDFIRLIMDKNWSGGSKGIFVSTDLDTLYYGNGWEEYEKGGEPQVMVSNKDYFKETKRGPFFEAQKREREAALKKAAEERRAASGETEATLTQAFGRTGSDTTDAKYFDQDRLSKSVVIIRALGGMFLNADMDTLAGVSQLAAVDIPEWDQLIQDENSMYIAACISKLCDKLHEATQELAAMEADLERAQKSATNAHLELKELKGGFRKVG